MKARLYRIDELQLAEKRQMAGQAALIAKAMSDAPHGISIRDISTKIADRLVTKQDPLRVVNFYISTWKKDGLVHLVEDSEDPVSRDANSPGHAAGATPASTPAVPATPSFDVAKATLVDAIKHIVDIDGASTPAEIRERLMMQGRSGVEMKNVQDACRRLVQKGVFVRGDGGVFDFAPEEVDADESETVNA